MEKAREIVLNYKRLREDNILHDVLMIASFLKVVELYTWWIGNGGNPKVKPVIWKLVDRAEKDAGKFLKNLTKEMNTNESKQFLSDLENYDYLLGMADILDAGLEMGYGQRDMISNFLRKMVEGKFVNIEILADVQESDIAKGDTIILTEEDFTALLDNISSIAIDEKKEFKKADVIRIASPRQHERYFIVGHVIEKEQFNILSVRKVKYNRTPIS